MTEIDVLSKTERWKHGFLSIFLLKRVSKPPKNFAIRPVVNRFVLGGKPPFFSAQKKPPFQRATADLQRRLINHKIYGASGKNYATDFE